MTPECTRITTVVHTSNLRTAHSTYRASPRATRQTSRSRRWRTQSVTSEGHHEASECSAVVDMMCGRCPNALDMPCRRDVHRNCWRRRKTGLASSSSKSGQPSCGTCRCLASSRSVSSVKVAQWPLTCPGRHHTPLAAMAGKHVGGALFFSGERANC